MPCRLRFCLSRQKANQERATGSFLVLSPIQICFLKICCQNNQKITSFNCDSTKTLPDFSENSPDGLHYWKTPSPDLNVEASSVCIAKEAIEKNLPQIMSALAARQSNSIPSLFLCYFELFSFELEKLLHVSATRREAASSASLDLFISMFSFELSHSVFTLLFSRRFHSISIAYLSPKREREYRCAYWQAEVHALACEKLNFSNFLSFSSDRDYIFNIAVSVAFVHFCILLYTFVHFCIFL